MNRHIDIITYDALFVYTQNDCCCRPSFYLLTYIYKCVKLVLRCLGVIIHKKERKSMEDFNTSSVASLLHELLSELMPREPQEMTKESLDYWNCTSAGLFNA